MGRRQLRVTARGRAGALLHRAARDRHGARHSHVRGDGESGVPRGRSKLARGGHFERRRGRRRSPGRVLLRPGAFAVVLRWVGGPERCWEVARCEVIAPAGTDKRVDFDQGPWWSMALGGAPPCLPAWCSVQHGRVLRELLACVAGYRWWPPQSAGGYVGCDVACSVVVAWVVWWALMLEVDRR